MRSKPVNIGLSMGAGEANPSESNPREESVAVVIPTRGRNHLLGRAVTSALRQEHPALIVYVVDDNQESDRVSIVLQDEPWLSDPRVRIIDNPEPKNAARARNLALTAARTKWITYLDDDDEYLPGKITEQQQLCLRRGVPLALCGFIVDLPLRQRVRQSNAEKYAGVELLTVACPGTPFLMHLNDRRLRFDETLQAHEDADFFFSALEIFGLNEVFLVSRPLVIVYPQRQNRVNTAAANSWRAQRRIYFKHFVNKPRELRHPVLARMLLSKAKHGGSFRVFWTASRSLFGTSGLSAVRAVLNAVLFRIPPLRRLLVS